MALMILLIEFNNLVIKLELFIVICITDKIIYAYVIENEERISEQVEYKQGQLRNRQKNSVIRRKGELSLVAFSVSAVRSQFGCLQSFPYP